MSVDQADLGPGGLEVVVLLGVDARHGLGPPLLDEVADGEGGRITGVVPARERRDQRGLGQRGSPAPTTCSIARDAIGRAPISCAGARIRSGDAAHLAARRAVRVRHADRVGSQAGRAVPGRGLCPGARAIGDDGTLDVEVIAERLRMPLVHDAEHGLWALGPLRGSGPGQAAAADPFSRTGRETRSGCRRCTAARCSSSPVASW